MQGYVYNNEQPLMPSHVGQVIMSTTLDTAAKVHAIYGGTWEAWGQGRVPVGVDPNDSDFNAPNKIGGAKTVTLTVEQMPSHRHALKTYYDSGTNQGWCFDNVGGKKSFFTNEYCAAEGGGQAHPNMQPYASIYMWLRTA